MRKESALMQKEFLDTIRFFRRRIDLAGFLRNLVPAFFTGAGVGIVFQAAAFVWPVYYANLYTLLAVLLAVLAALAVSFFRRCSMKGAALVMDEFGFQERIVTAYENLGREGELIELQRRDAMERLQMEKDRIQIPLWPSWRKLAGIVGMFLFLIVLAFLPSERKERAKEQYLLAQEAREKVEEIETVLEDLEKLKEEAGQELREEQLAALQEMMDSLNSSILEYQQAASSASSASAEAMAAAMAKLDFKYGEMGNQLAQLAQELQGGAAPSVSVAQSMEEMAQKLQGMSGSPTQAGGMMADGSKGQSSAGGNQGDGSGEGTGSNQEGAENGSGEGTGSGQEGAGNGSGEGTGSGQEGAGNGSGEGEGSGQEGAGNGSGEGTGSGQEGAGNGSGSGLGRGEGSGTGIHDYVSVPNAVVDSGSLTGSAGGHEDSEYFRAQNGLSWEGEHVSHEAVIGSYQERAYEGIAAGRYPSGMEDVIKEYFSGFHSSEQ